MILLLAGLACTPDDGEPIVLVHTAVDTGAATPTVEVVDKAMGTGLQDDAFGTFKRGRGCTVSDLDLDGDLDLVLSNPADATYVLLNDGRGGFTPGPILDASELIWAASAADMDGDGDEDLFLAVGGLEGLGFDRLLRNDRVETGFLTFTDVTAAAGVAGPVGRSEGYEEPIGVASLGGAWVDFDGDADLDIYVDTTPWPVLWVEDIPEDTVIGRNLLWQNNGDGTFTEVAEAMGLSLQGSSRYSSWLDIDNDGDLDLFENNKDSRPNVLWRNDGGMFTQVTAEWALDGGDLGYPLETFASAAGDVNHDGWEDLLLFVRGLSTEGPYQIGHTLLLNAQGRGFVDATAASNINDPFYSGYRDHLSNGVMGASWRDLDGDGLLDLFAGNGGPGSGFPNMIAHATGLVPVDLGPEAGTLDVPLYEDWSGRFQFPAAEDPGTAAAYPQYPYRTHAGCVADLDGDGQTELLEMNGGMSWVGGDAVKEPNRWFHVVQSVPPGSVQVELVGDGVNVPATPIGTRIEVVLLEDGVERTQWDTLRSSTGFAAQHGTRVHVGTGQASAVVRVTAHWADGTVTSEEAPALQSRITLRR
jgi:hypothetical protein